jgi:hypothetical protein
MRPADRRTNPECVPGESEVASRGRIGEECVIRESCPAVKPALAAAR